MDVENMIEAGARAMWLAQRDHESAAWDRAEGLPIDDDWREFWREVFRTSFSAALAEARAQGAVLAMVPEDHDDDARYQRHQDYIDGFNAAIAVMRAREVKL